MASTHEVAITSASGVVYRFRLGIGAVCQLEETLNLDMSDIVERWTAGKFRGRLLREFIKVAAVEPAAPTADAADALIDALGILPAVGVVGDCIRLAFEDPTAEEVADALLTGSNGNGSKVRPTRPPVGKRARRATGADISTPAPS